MNSLVCGYYTFDRLRTFQTFAKRRKIFEDSWKEVRHLRYVKAFRLVEGCFPNSRLKMEIDKGVRGKNGGLVSMV